MAVSRRGHFFCFVIAFLFPGFMMFTNGQDTTKLLTVSPDSSQHLAVTDTSYPERKLYRLDLPYIKGYWTDFKHVVSRPFHWKGKDWRNFSIFIGVTAATFSVDWEVRKFALANQHSAGSDVAKVIEPFGNFYGAYLFPVMYVTGLVTKQKRLQSVALGGVKSLAISTIIYASSKTIIRRARPDATSSSHDFAPPFMRKSFTSTPSGHSNTIFTVATALAMEYRETKWVPIVAYTLATLTAVSRIYQNRHWASDVVLGSAIGHFVTRAVWKNNNKKAVAKQLW